MQKKLTWGNALWQCWESKTCWILWIDPGHQNVWNPPKKYEEVQNVLQQRRTAAFVCFDHVQIPNFFFGRFHHVIFVPRKPKVETNVYSQTCQGWLLDSRTWGTHDFILNGGSPCFITHFLHSDLEVQVSFFLGAHTHTYYIPSPI